MWHVWLPLTVRGLRTLYQYRPVSGTVSDCAGDSSEGNLPPAQWEWEAGAYPRPAWPTFSVTKNKCTHMVCCHFQTALLSLRVNGVRIPLEQMPYWELTLRRVHEVSELGESMKCRSSECQRYPSVYHHAVRLDLNAHSEIPTASLP